MKTFINVFFFILLGLVFTTITNIYAYQNSNYSIDFPKGWVVEDRESGIVSSTTYGEDLESFASILISTIDSTYSSIDEITREKFNSLFDRVYEHIGVPNAELLSSKKVTVNNIAMMKYSYEYPKYEEDLYGEGYFIIDKGLMHHISVNVFPSSEYVKYKNAIDIAIDSFKFSDTSFIDSYYSTNARTVNHAGIASILLLFICLAMLVVFIFIRFFFLKIKNIKQLKINESEIIAYESPDASKQKRLINLIIDSIFISILSNITSAYVVLDYSNLLLSITLSMLVPICVYFFYYFICELIFGQTLGKLITQTKVLGRDGRSVGTITVMLRTLIRMIPLEPFTFLVSSAGLHDKWSKTIVVDISKSVPVYKSTLTNTN